MEWLGVLLMLLVAMGAAWACSGVVRLLYVLAPPIETPAEKPQQAPH